MINRKIAPVVEPIRHIDYLKAEKERLENGLPIYYIDAPGQEVVKIDFIFEAGAWQQDEKLVASFTSYMLQEGTKKYNSAAIAGLFDYYGAYIQAAADQDFATVSIISLNKYLPEILEVTEEILKRPSFPQHELDVLLEKHRQKFRLDNEKVKVLCQKKFTTVLFGEDHPYSVNNRMDNFDRITRDKLQSFFRRCYHPGNCRVVVAGNANGEVRSLMARYFGGNDWKTVPATACRFSASPSPEKYHKVVKPGSLQSAIRVGREWVGKDHPDFPALSVLVTLLGGYFGSRLMLNIREEKGYTYGIGAYVMTLKEAAYLVISTEVGSEYTDATIAEINRELKRLQDEPVPDDELATVKSFLMGEFLRDFDGPFALANSFKAINDFGLDYDFYDRYLTVLNEIRPKELQRLACDYLPLIHMYTVIAGAV
ncbi:MAG: pitrilysin family protein [Prolixibacteraceae bacterium]|jgi:predicted Zn-dependent peptidase|nr:pitrilysin family protein [Prolixibacteraceae bacterium]